MANTGYDEGVAMADDIAVEGDGSSMRDALDTIRTRFDAPSPMSKARSLSDGGGTQLSPSPNITGASRRTSKDDSSLRDPASAADIGPPVTPRRPDFPIRGLSIQLPRRDPSPVPAAAASVRPSPLSPQIDRSHIYASPTNILPRRSRGLDFSRAATSLHHSTLAEQSSPDSSPTIGGGMGRAMDIPGRSIGDFGTEQTTKSLWSMMGDRERNQISSSVGSANPLASSSSSSSDDDDYMDDFVDDSFLGTPTAAKTGPMMVDQTTPQSLSASPGLPWLASNSPAMNSLSSFRTRPRKPPKRKLRGLLNLGFRSANPSGATRSPPHNLAKDGKDVSASQSRRESISWAANQLHISSADAEDRAMESIESPQRGVIKRTVTRRGNLLPKTKGFARIRAALAEEGAPVDCETRREAEVIRQVRESDTDLEPRVPSAPPAPLDIASAPQLSPNMQGDNLEDVLEDDMLGEPSLSASFKQQALKNFKGKGFWETFSETSSVAGGSRVTPPPPSFLPRGSSSGISEDVNMDSPSMSTGSGPTATATNNHNNVFGPGPALLGIGGNRPDTPQAPASAPEAQQPQRGRLPPSAEEITRRINNKRRRDDDLDPVSFKRRAVSPGMSVHNSPVMQSPLQRDNLPWGGSRPSSNGAEKASGSPSDHSSSGANNSNNNNNGGSRPPNGSKGRVGFQGMVDTNDGLMRMSIE